MSEGKIIGGRAPSSDEVYAGSRGTDPKTGEPTSVEVEVGDTGTIRTFCVVNIPGLSELAPPVPYVSAQIVLDGANNTFFGLIRGVEPDEVRMGMRVKAIWADELKPDHTLDQVVGAERRTRRRLRDLQGVPVRDVAVRRATRLPRWRRRSTHNEVEIITPVIREAVERARASRRKEIGFTCSGSLDYLFGGPFAFVQGIDAVGAWPPIRESHVEMDAAWALYEAWIAIQTGEVDSALIYGFSKGSLGDVAEIMAHAARPVLPHAAVALDVRPAPRCRRAAYLEESGRTERDLAEVAARSQRERPVEPARGAQGRRDAPTTC